jgi:glycerophosphoryl diester phosphodiesterase
VSDLFSTGAGRPLVVAHRGAARLAPENTLRTLELAFARGAHAAEVDVVALADRTLVLGHSLELSELCHGAARGPAGKSSLAELRALDPELATLSEALELLAGESGGRSFLLDLKDSCGKEAAQIAALVREHGLARRTLLCSLDRALLGRLRSLAPEIARSVSYPRDRYRLSERSLLAPVKTLGLTMLRPRLALGLSSWLEEAGASAATLQHLLVSRRLVEACHSAGVAVIAWTVDDDEVRSRLASIDTDAIITDDPSFFPPPSR